MTEMMKRFEEETGKHAGISRFPVGGYALDSMAFPTLGTFDYGLEYVSWLEAKAEAYDRVCQGKGANLMEGKFIAIDMEEQTVFILSGDSEYLKQQEDTLLGRGGTLLHEQEKINDTISMMAFELTKANHQLVKDIVKV